MTYTTGTNFTIGSTYTSGTNFTISSGSGENNTSELTSGILTLIGLTPSTESFDNSYSAISDGTITFIGSKLISASANILGIDAYTVTIQLTQDLYYLSDSMSEFDVDYYPYHESALPLDLVGHVLVYNNARATQTHTILSPTIIDLSYLQDYYYRIHLSIINLDLGNVVSEQIFYIEVWNSYFVTDVLETLIGFQVNDITLTVPFSIPHTFKPLENAILELNVTPKGTPIINGSYTFTFATESVVLYITGRRVVLWPFAPTTTFREARSWLTDVVEARNNETRYAIRLIPRTSLDYKFNFKTSEQFALANTMAKSLANLSLGVPVWSDVTYLSNLSAGDTVITMPTANLELAIGTVIVLWASFKVYELATIESLTSTSITLTNALLNAHASCWLVPVLIGYAAADITFSEDDNFSRTGVLKIEAVDTYSSGSFIGSVTFQGLPVLTTLPVVTGGLTKKYSREQAKFDSITGNYTKFDNESYNRAEGTLSFFALSLSERYKLRRFFDYLKGKYTAFWLPSFTDDIVAVEPLVVSSNSLHVVNNFYETYPPQYIRVIGENTQMFQVNSVSDNLDGTAYFTLATVASPAINNITQIEIMTKVRLNSDNLEFAHKGKNITSIKAPVIEVKA